MRKDDPRRWERQFFKSAAKGARAPGSRPRRMPRPRRTSEREGRVEDSCVRRAKDLGWQSRKMNGMGFASWPDRIFLPPEGARGHSRFWVEFKREGEDPTPRQAAMHKELAARGETVHVCRTREEFAEALEAHSAAGRRR